MQLIKADDGFHLWSETYDRTLDNIFQIQDEIAAAVVDALKITLLGEEPRSTETNPEAYALYLQGRHFSNQGTAESHKQAETLLKQALAIDSGFAPAWTNLGNVYRTGANALGVRPFEEGNELARDAIQKALAIDPQYGPAYAALAMIEIEYDWDFTAAAQHLQQALALNPGDAIILHSAVNQLLILTHHNTGNQPLTRRIGADTGSNVHADLQKSGPLATESVVVASMKYLWTLFDPL